MFSVACLGFGEGADYSRIDKRSATFKSEIANHTGLCPVKDTCWIIRGSKPVGAVAVNQEVFARQ